MKIGIAISLFITVFCLHGFAQNLECKDFRTGRFYIPNSSKVDTMYLHDSTTNIEEILGIHDKLDEKKLQW